MSLLNFFALKIKQFQTYFLITEYDTKYEHLTNVTEMTEKHN